MHEYFHPQGKDFEMPVVTRSTFPCPLTESETGDTMGKQVR